MMERNCKKLAVILIIFAMLFSSVGQVFADDATDAKIERLEKMLMQMQSEINQLKAEKASRKAMDKQQVETVVKEVIKESDVKSAELPEWLETMKLSGDFRFRHQYTDDDTSEFTRNRNRIRARIRLDSKINDEVDVVVRLATGDDDSPTSTNQTLGGSADGFSSKDVWLDWGYADWHPNWLANTNIIMGKAPTAFYKAGKNQLIWDGDLSMEGVAAKHKMQIDKSTALHINGGGFWIKETSSDNDISLWGIQGYLDHKLADGSKLIGGASFYDYGNIKGNSISGFGSKGNSGTTVGDDFFYANDYNILEGFGEYVFSIDDTPASLFGSYVQNIAAANEDNGWLIGAKYNKAKDKGTWELSYSYRDIEADAVVGGLNDSDFAGGGTNVRGHTFGGKYQVSENMHLGLTYFLSEKNVSTTKDNYDSLLADLVFKF